MLSIILYGRNDNHGYNYNKRVALSLNNMAESLIGKSDEIIFVDWNTHENLPTLIESVSDTLSETTKKYLKIIRVSPDIHESLVDSVAPLPTLEPFARNCAIRRMNEKNNWILSTNTDMLFKFKREALNFRDILLKINSGYWGIPRIPVAEVIWDNWNRLDPISVINELKTYEKTLIPKICVYSNDILFDAPGDFQLVDRTSMFKVKGFDESMIRGWHVDSNLVRRLEIAGIKVSAIDQYLDGFHCEHNRENTHFFKRSITNDLKKYFDDVKYYDANNNNNWGLKDLELEKIEFKDLPKFKINRTLRALTTNSELRIENNIKTFINWNSSDSDKIFKMPINIFIGHIVENIMMLEPNSRILVLQLDDTSNSHFIKILNSLRKDVKFLFFNAKKEHREFLIEFTKSENKLVIVNLSFNEGLKVSERFNLSMSDVSNLKYASLILYKMGKILKDKKNANLKNCKFLTLNATYNIFSQLVSQICFDNPNAMSSRVRFGKFKFRKDVGSINLDLYQYFRQMEKSMNNLGGVNYDMKNKFLMVRSLKEMLDRLFESSDGLNGRRLIQVDSLDKNVHLLPGEVLNIVVSDEFALKEWDIMSWEGNLRVLTNRILKNQLRFRFNFFKFWWKPISTDTSLTSGWSWISDLGGRWQVREIPKIEITDLEQVENLVLIINDDKRKVIGGLEKLEEFIFEYNGKLTVFKIKSFLNLNYASQVVGVALATQHMDLKNIVFEQQADGRSLGIQVQSVWWFRSRIALKVILISIFVKKVLSSRFSFWFHK
jgi:hypothetical protein